MQSENFKGSALCLECALCCNGALFADVRLRIGDDAARLAQAGMRLRACGSGKKFAQPCAALCGTRCDIYEMRPAHCREFECALLKRYEAGEIGAEHALRKIRAARRKLKEVERLFGLLEDGNEHLPLKQRLGNLTRRLERTGLAKERAEIFGRLTLAVHDLHLMLAREFYPGSPGRP